ncbi:eukaryotic translation initiation factor 4E-binding protein Mextli isoform X1 [Cylas formicarius]|uniref:eukaryotic translation initiation factor 4E-binding protein Mextli isoform X1 n=1 Tax=Cylas formicarius TaxID=197179 RepID=UPI0029586ADF|nr:eukaryotic translation initiation factor 4E-binding protein Mextli isoform X1 [Cylas formicarius]
MSSSLSSRLKQTKKHELAKSQSQAQLLANKLRQDGLMATVESVVQAVEQVTALLVSDIESISCRDSIINLCQHLKVYGAYLEILYKEQLDHAFKIIRDKAQDDLRLNRLLRLYLLELIELRAKGWKETDGMNNYYRKKTNQCSQDFTESIASLSDSLPSLITVNSTPLLSPGEVLKPSGKFAKPTRIPGKKYCKDEVVIRNADSGKVMGIKGRRVHMIEELSETIISFQRVSPGAKERLVQITGANEESINHAKQLMEDTIKRNASPTREQGMPASGPLTGSSSSINSSASDDSALPPSNRASRALMHSMSTPDANISEYKYTVITNGYTIKITGDNLDLVRTSKLVLDEYFSGEPIHDVADFCSFDSLPGPLLTDDLESSIYSSESRASPGEVSNRLSPSTRGSTAEPPNVVSSETDQSKIRKPRLSADEILQEIKIVKNKEQESRKIDKTRLTYSIEVLAQLAMSPLCLTEPSDWKRISEDHPTLLRKVVQSFDANNYLLSCKDGPSELKSDENIVTLQI